MGLPKPKPSGYFARRKGILDDWDSLTATEQQKFTVDNKRWLTMQERRRKVGKLRKSATKRRVNRDPETTAKNKAAKAAADLANKRNREMNAAVSRCVKWIDEDGNQIPKTIAGIELHKALVLRTRAKYPRVRILRNALLRYRAIEQKADTQRKNAEADAAVKARIAERAKLRAAAKKRIAVERTASAKRKRKASINSARSLLFRSNHLIGFWKGRVKLSRSRLDRSMARRRGTEKRRKGLRGIVIVDPPDKRQAEEAGIDPRVPIEAGAKQALPCRRRNPDGKAPSPYSRD